MIQQTTRTVIKKVDAHGLTPTILFQRLQGSYKFLLETDAAHISTGRYSFMGANPRKTYVGYDTTLHEIVHATNKTYHYDGDLVLLLKQVMPRVSNETSYPFTGGALGYIRYNRSKNEIPAAHFHVYDTILLFDHVTEELVGIFTNIDPEKKEDALDALMAQVLKGAQDSTTYELGAFTSPSGDEQLNDLHELSELLAQENIQQLMVAQQLHAPFEGDSFAYYETVRQQSPSPYQYYMQFDDHEVFGSAHDRILRVKEQTVLTSEPTCHTLLDTASIQKEGEFTSGVLKEGYHAIDALATVIPTSAVIGSPVDEAAALLNDSKVDQRLLYGGAIGYIGFNGQIDFAHSNSAIVIKSAHAIKEEVYQLTQTNPPQKVK